MNKFKVGITYKTKGCYQTLLVRENSYVDVNHMDPEKVKISCFENFVEDSPRLVSLEKRIGGRWEYCGKGILNSANSHEIIVSLDSFTLDGRIKRLKDSEEDIRIAPECLKAIKSTVELGCGDMLRIKYFNSELGKWVKDFDVAESEYETIKNILPEADMLVTEGGDTYSLTTGKITTPGIQDTYKIIKKDLCRIKRTAK